MRCALFLAQSFPLKCPKKFSMPLLIQRRQFGKKKGGGGGGQRRSYEPIQKTNEKFERYYNELGIIPEEEREAFWEALRRDLPNSFRFTGSRGYVIARRRSRLNWLLMQRVQPCARGTTAS